MKRTIWTIIITGMLVQANAQWYNYMGNRVIFNMEASFSPAWKSPNPVSTGWDIPEGLQRYLGLNYFLYPSVELMVWEKGTVGAGYDYYSSPFDGSDDRVYVDGYGSDWYNLRGNITAHGFNVYYKQYLGNRFAPLGHHFKFTFDGFFYHYQMDSTANITLHGITSAELPSVLDNKGVLFGLKIDYGYDFVVANRLKLTMGFGVGTTFGGYRVPFNKMRDFFSDFDFGDGNTSDKPVTFDNYARTRILGAYWFGLRFGIGFIAF